MYYFKTNHIFYLLFNLLIDNYAPYIYNIHVIPFVHACITSSYSNYLLFNDQEKYFNISIYEKNEINELYYSVPLYTFIYLFFHVKDALSKNKEYILHAYMMIFMCGLCIYGDKNHYFTNALLIESSTVFLHLMYAFKYDVFKYMFVTSFVIYRGFIFPYMCIHFTQNHYNDIIRANNIHFLYFCILLLSNYLNMNWLFLIYTKLKKQHVS